MKTLTLLKSYDYASWLYSQMDGEDEKLQRQIETFRGALLRRIEAGDQAREALRQVEHYHSTYETCPWCYDKYPDHKSDCPRQIALGAQP